MTKRDPHPDAVNIDIEHMFILDCLRVKLSQDCASLSPPSSLNWDRFYRLLVQNRLVGLFYAICKANPNLWPMTLRESLREDRYRQLFYSDWCKHQAASMLAALQRKYIPIIALKGWALVQILYEGDHGQRTSSDIDLLVKPQDAALVDNILHAMGYRDVSVEPWPGYFRRYMNSRHYISAQEYVPLGWAFNIDVHWGVPDSPYYDNSIAIEPLFERSFPLKVSGVEINSLATEDYLLYACSHIAHHGYSQSLLQYYEIAALILRAGPTLNWEIVMTNASTWRVTIPLRHIISDIGKLWPGIIPSYVHEVLEEVKSSWGERYIDWCLTNSTRKEAVVVILSCLNTPGLFWRLSYIPRTSGHK